MKNRCIDLVVSGPDMSGTSTQIEVIKDFFQNKGMKVRDLRGTELDALFHAEVFRNYNNSHESLKRYLNDPIVNANSKKQFIYKASKLLITGNTNQDLKVASFLKNNISTHIDPDSADVWLMEEPPKRGAGQVNRTIEQNRTVYGMEVDHTAAAYCHQAYRIDEFLRFRKPLREKDKIIVRSRSEESACYQVYDSKWVPNGIHMDEYLKLPGHKIAFGNPPTNLFLVCHLYGMTAEEYINIKRERSGDRFQDDYESNAGFQALVNERYAGYWINLLYEKGCGMHGSKMPKFTRFHLLDSKEEIKQKMDNNLEVLYKNYSLSIS